jgi:hypothetical protein
MRRLANPHVVRAAITAAALSAAFSLPRMLLWDKRPLPLWYLETTIFLGGFVLWAFVFAWHTEYTHRPVLTLKINLPLFAGATLAGIVTALCLLVWIDPPVRHFAPEEFPADLAHWIASTLFALAFTQLFLLYAPVAWLMRLFRNEKIATWLTVLLGIVVLFLRSRALPTALPFPLMISSVVLRIGITFFAVWFYLRGGILLVSWLGLVIEARHLLEFATP